MSIAGSCMVPHPPIIIPEIGRGEEKKISATTAAYEKAADYIVNLDPETIIISSPHSVMYYDYFHISPGSSATGNFGRFRAPQVRFQKEYDTALVQEISRIAENEHFPAGCEGEKDPHLDHGTMIPLYFIDKAYRRAGKTPNYRIIRIGLSGLPLTDHYRLGMMVMRAANELGRKTVWVASGDLSHKCRAEGPYGFDPRGPEYDSRIMDTMGSADFGKLFDFSETFCEKAAECGHRSFVMMAGALDSLEVVPERLSHEDTFGVGYGVCIYRLTGREDKTRNFLEIFSARERKRLDAKFAAQDPYVRLARLSLETYVLKHRRLTLKEAERLLTGKCAFNNGLKHGTPAPNEVEKIPEETAASRNELRHCNPAPDESEKTPEETVSFPDELICQCAGTFVSIHENGRLRGCIGTISPTRPTVAEEILQNAISAGTRDPRFDAVRPDELGQLEYSVDVLGVPEDISSLKELDPKRYGVIVTKGRKRGLLLPNLDGVDTAEEQVRIAKQKAFLSDDEEGCHLQRFEVVRHY